MYVELPATCTFCNTVTMILLRKEFVNYVYHSMEFLYIITN